MTQKNEEGEVGKPGAFKIYAMEPWSGLMLAPSLGRTPYEQSGWPDYLQQVSLGEVFIDDTDVEVYIWTRLLFLLTGQASQRLQADRPRETIFVATLGQERLYGGLILPFCSARAVDFPVIVLLPEGEREGLHIYPRFPSTVFGADLLPAALLKRIKVEKVGRHFLALHKLRTGLQKA